MKLDWQVADIKTLVRVVAILRGEIGKKLVVAGFCSGNQNKGAVYSDPMEIMPDGEGYYDQVGVAIEHIEQFIEDNDIKGRESELHHKEIKALSEIDKELYVLFNWNDRTDESHLDNVETFTADEVGVAEFTYDAMNGHVWSGTVEEAISAIVDMAKTGQIGKDVWEICRFVGFRYDAELRDLEMNDFVDTIAEYFSDIMPDTNHAFWIGRDFILVVHYEPDAFYDKLQKYYNLSRKEEDTIDEFSDLIYRSGNFFAIDGTFFENCSAIKDLYKNDEGDSE